MVTQGAVSHQVKALEVELGVKFFDREPKRLIITEAGRRYQEVVRDALERIAAGTDSLQQRQNAGVLTIRTSPNFASKWLVATGVGEYGFVARTCFQSGQHGHRCRRGRTGRGPGTDRPGRP
ncbi:MAG: LysR family transcriptional regulator [Alphaproteobacteria bacterium]